MNGRNDEGGEGRSGRGCTRFQGGASGGLGGGLGGGRVSWVPFVDLDEAARALGVRSGGLGGGGVRARRVRDGGEVPRSTGHTGTEGAVGSWGARGAPGDCHERSLPPQNLVGRRPACTHQRQSGAPMLPQVSRPLPCIGGGHWPLDQVRKTPLQVGAGAEATYRSEVD